MNFNFFVSPQKNEVINTSIHINSQKPALIGSVLSSDDTPIKDAFLIAYEVDKKDHKLKKVSGFSYTDEWGSFAIAPLENDTLYNVKVYKNNENLRILQTELE